MPGGGGSRGNHGMDWYLGPGRSVVILLVASCEETRIISPWTGWTTAQIQTLPNYLLLL